MLSILLIALAAFSLAIFRSDLLMKSDLTEYTQDLARALQFDDRGMPTHFDTSSDEDGWIYESLKQETAYRVLDDQGRTALVSAGGDDFWPPSEGQRLDPGHFTFERDGLRIHGVITLTEHNGRVWILQLGVSTRLMDFMYQEFTFPFVGAGIAIFSLVLFFVFSICAYVTLKFTLKPLRTLSEHAAAISPCALHARLQTKNVPLEISPLVDSFNGVLERLEHGYRAQQEFLATAAHELKTPLALIRAQVELMGESDDRGYLLTDVEHMSRQVQQLLLLAEASEVQNYCFTMVEVQGVAREAVAYLHRMAETANVCVTLSADASTSHWKADRGALFTIMKNLLENAIQHSPEGTEVQVMVDNTTVTVRDRGPGVSSEQLPHLFSRFWRGPHRRDHGAGLGLSICREIAVKHGWQLSAYREKPGLMLRVSSATGENDIGQGLPERG